MKPLSVSASGTGIRQTTLDVVDAHIAAVAASEAFALNYKDAAVSDVACDRAKAQALPAYAAFLEALLNAVEHILTVSEVDGTPVSSDAVRSLAIVPGAHPTCSADEIQDKFVSRQRDLAVYQAVPGVPELVEAVNDVWARNTTAFLQRLARPLGISLTLPAGAESDYLASLREQRATGAAAPEPAASPGDDVARAERAVWAVTSARAVTSQGVTSAQAVMSQGVASAQAVTSAQAVKPAPAPVAAIDRAGRAVWAALTSFRADFHTLTSSQQAKLDAVVVLGRVVDARGKPQPVQLATFYYSSGKVEPGILVGDHDFYDINKADELRALLQRNLAEGIPIDRILTTLFEDVGEHLRSASTPSATLYTWPRTAVPALGDREPGFILQRAREFRDRFASRIPSLANPTLRECAIDRVLVNSTNKYVRAELRFERGNLWLMLDGQVAADLTQPNAELQAIVRLQERDSLKYLTAHAITQMMDEAARKFIAEDVEKANVGRAPQRAALLSPPAAAPSSAPVAAPKETLRVRAGAGPASGASTSSTVRSWTPPAIKERYEGAGSAFEEERDVRALFESFEAWVKSAWQEAPLSERGALITRLPSGGDNIDMDGNCGPVRVVVSLTGEADLVVADGCLRRPEADSSRSLQRYVRGYQVVERSIAAVALRAFCAAATAIERRLAAAMARGSAAAAATATPGRAERLPFVPGNMKLMAGARYDGQAEAVFAAVSDFQHWLQQLVAGAKNPKQLADVIIGSDFAYTVVGADAGNHSVRIAVDRDLRCTLGFDDRRVDRRAELATLLAKYPEASSGFVKGLESLFAVASRKLMQSNAL